jgi:methyl-accepting chemotaxis protein
MAMKHFRRRKFLVDKRLQIRFIAVSLGYVAFYIFVTIAAAFIPLAFTLRTARFDSHTAYLTANNLIYLHQHIWPIALIVIILVSLHSLWLSHKVAGPLFRFRQIFRALAAGKLPDQQRLRKRDYLQPEMKLINEMLHSLQSRMENFQEAQKAIANSISGVVRRSRIVSDSELTSLVEDLEKKGKELEKNAMLFCREP